MEQEQEILEEEIDEDYVPTEEDLLDYANWLGIELPKERDLLWIAEKGLVAKLPENWKPCRTPEGDLYYFDFETGESAWEHPCDTIFKELYQEEKAKQLAAAAPGTVPNGTVETSKTVLAASVRDGLAAQPASTWSADLSQESTSDSETTPAPDAGSGSRNPKQQGQHEQARSADASGAQAKQPSAVAAAEAATLGDVQPSGAPRDRPVQLPGAAALAPLPRGKAQLHPLGGPLGQWRPLDGSPSDKAASDTHDAADAAAVQQAVEADVQREQATSAVDEANYARARAEAQAQHLSQMANLEAAVQAERAVREADLRAESARQLDTLRLELQREAESERSAGREHQREARAAADVEVAALSKEIDHLLQERTAERASLLADVQRDLERLQRAKAEQTLAIEQQTAELATLKEQHADRIAALEAELSKGVESVTAEADKQRAQAREAALQEAQQYRVTLLAAARAAAAEEASRDAAPPASNHMERSTGVESSTQTGVSDEADGSMPRASDASARGSEIGLPAGGIGGEQGRRAADDAAAAEELARLQGLREEMQASTREQVAKEAAVQQEELAAARRQRERQRGCELAAMEASATNALTQARSALEDGHAAALAEQRTQIQRDHAASLQLLQQQLTAEEDALRSRLQQAQADARAAESQPSPAPIYARPAHQHQRTPDAMEGHASPASRAASPDSLASAHLRHSRPACSTSASSASPQAPDPHPAWSNVPRSMPLAGLDPSAGRSHPSAAAAAHPEGRRASPPSAPALGVHALRQRRELDACSAGAASASNEDIELAARRSGNGATSATSGLAPNLDLGFLAHLGAGVGAGAPAAGARRLLALPQGQGSADAKGEGQRMLKQARAFLRLQKQLIRRRQAAMRDARDEWQQSAAVLTSIPDAPQRDQLQAVLSQVHEVLEAQAKRLNDDALQLAVMRDRLQGDSPSAHAAPGAGNASTEFSFSRFLAYQQRANPAAHAGCQGQQQRELASATMMQEMQSKGQAAEQVLESHARWLKAFREQISRASHASHGRMSSSRGGSLRHGLGQPVRLDLGDHRELVISVQGVSC